MQSPNRYQIALLSAYALALHGFESMFPSPVPWLRLGLANIVTLITLLLYGLRAAVTVTLIRVVLASILNGTFLGPAFLLSLGGGILSTLSMGFFASLTPRLFSATGLSLIGALFHNGAQLLLAYALFIQRIEAVLLITPLIVLLGTLTGTINGIVSELIIKNLKKSGEKIQNVDT
ncbi:MAG: Gx transporter family protein [Thermodesulfovibrionales bacterium]|nr:Gx transporter family protein [Thermodesulfovibrionales bacterium]